MRFDPCSQQHRVYTTSLVACLLLHYRARPLPSTFRIMRRYLKRCWQLGDLPPPRWIHESNLQFEHRILCTSGSLLPFQPGDKSKLLFVGLITCLEWIVAFNWSADPFCNWNIDTLIIFDKFLTFFFLKSCGKICGNYEILYISRWNKECVYHFWESFEV